MLIPIVIFLVGLVGAALVAFGAWLLAPPAGYIVAGVLCLAWSWMAARAGARQPPPTEEGSR
jgi:hypothetical protein